MNWEKLESLVNWRVRIRPIAKRFDGDLPLPLEDDIWIVQRVAKKAVVELANIRTGHLAKLGNDHIHHFVSDPPAETDGFRHAILDLDVQLLLRGQRLEIEPIRREKQRDKRPQAQPGTQGPSVLTTWHSSTHASYLVELETTGQVWPVPVARNHCHLSYHICRSSFAELPQQNFLRLLQQAGEEVRKRVWTGWSMFYVFPDEDLRPRVSAEFIGGHDTDVYRCSHLGHHSDTTVPDYWKVTRNGLATICRPYREDRQITSSQQGNKVVAGRWFSKLLLVREITELVTHGSAMLAHFPDAHRIDFECTWMGLSERSIFDDLSNRFGRSSYGDGRTCQASAGASSLSSKWPAVVSQLANRILILFEDGVTPEWVASAAPRFKMDWLPQP